MVKTTVGTGSDEPAVSELSERYRRVAGQLTRRVEAVAQGAWENPSPCEGWLARDVVGHLVTWIPAFLHGYAAIELPAGPPVDQDPVGAWRVVCDAIQAVLEDPCTAARAFDSPDGRVSVGEAVDRFITADVLVHTWDLARAAGLDDSLDAAAVRSLLDRVELFDAALRASGHYGPRVEVPEDADDQSRLLAFLGRQP